MKKTLLFITILCLGLGGFAQMADSVEQVAGDTIKVPKNKTIKVTVGDKELLNVDVPADEFDMSDIKEEKSGDTTRLRVGKKNITIVQEGNKLDHIDIDEDEDSDNDFSWDEDEDDYKSKKFKGHWGGLELGLNNFMNTNNQLELPSDGQFMELNTSKSIEFSLNFAEKSFSLYENKFGIVTGMGIKWNNYHFDKNILLDPESVYSTTVVDTSFDKNKLGITFLTVPLLFEYQIHVGKKKKPIYLSTGVIGGLKIGSRTKQEYTVNGKDYEDKTKEDFNLSPYTYAVTARLGFKNVNVFANYSLVPLFEKNKGPVLYPLTIGISLLN